MTSPQHRPRPVVLIVIDGWGINPRSEGNAIALAQPPVMSRLAREYPATELGASGLDVGLPVGQMGNSEVGHLNIGAGLIVYQDITRIDQAIADGSFFANAELLAACAHVQQSGGHLHLLGLLGSGGVHSHWHHLYALHRLAVQEGIGERTRHHFFLDGRDTPPRSALGFVQEATAQMVKDGPVHVATVSGRYYAMDRDNRWERVQRAYAAIVQGVGEHAPDAATAVQHSYDQGVTDEFVLPTLIGAGDNRVRAGDAVIFYNFRSDRGRELTKAITLPAFDGFERGEQVRDLYYVTMTEYEKGLPVRVAFPASDVAHPLAEVVSAAGLRQFHTAETEKYAHVTFFLNGGREEAFAGEDRELVPSAKVATYDLQPEMSAAGVTDGLIKAIASDTYDFCVVNYANPDMVGHTGVLAAAERAVLTTDQCIGRVVAATLPRGVVIITADHGNAETELDYDSGQPHTAHTSNPVPFILVSNEPTLKAAQLRSGGRLADIAPTILQLLGLPAPAEMSGRSLIERLPS